MNPYFNMRLTSFFFGAIHTLTIWGIPSGNLPTVDLGYVHQRATSYNETTRTYTYRNIRYARPPLNDLRFRKPQPPLKEPYGTISDGNQYSTTVCPQAFVSNGTPSDRGFTEDCLVSRIL